MKKRYIVAVVVLLCLCIFAVGGLFMTRNSVSSKASKLKTEVDELAVEIRESMQLTPSSALPTPATYPDEFYKAYKLGFEAAPFLLDYVIKNNDNSLYGDFFVAAAANNLHLNKLLDYDHSSTQMTQSEKYTPVWYAEKLKELAKEAPSKINEICVGEADISEKTIALEQYGMLAIPTLQKKINSGELQWIQCASLLTLSVLNDSERFDVLSYGYSDEVSDAENRNELIHQKRLAAVRNKGFDIKWFDNKAKELKLMSRLFN